MAFSQCLDHAVPCVPHIEHHGCVAGFRTTCILVGFAILRQSTCHVCVMRVLMPGPGVRRSLRCKT